MKGTQRRVVRRRRGVVMLLVAGVAGGCGGAAGARAPTAAQTEIVYDLGQSGMYGVRGDGTHQGPIAPPVQLNNTEVTPAFSADGRRAATWTYLGGAPTGGLVVSSTDGSPGRVVWKTSDSANGSSLVWNPAGTELAVFTGPTYLDSGDILGGPVYPSGLWVIDANGTHRHRLVPDASGGSGNLAWSPDGKKLAYWSASGLQVVSVSSGKQTLLTNPRADGSLSWSPNGGDILVAFQGVLNATDTAMVNSQVVRYPVSGGPPTIVLPPAPHVSYRQAIYSPDGSEIALIVNVLTGAPYTEIPTIQVASVDGTGLRTIVRPPGAAPQAVFVGWFKRSSTERWRPTPQVPTGPITTVVATTVPFSSSTSK